MLARFARAEDGKVCGVQQNGRDVRDYSRNGCEFPSDGVARWEGIGLMVGETTVPEIGWFDSFP